ncbi:MAG: hypothetical protein FPO08_14780 [Geobacter sp.]|nr:MAG: hypothetical protein FPO08_14780 [Geobacter sp.]
MRGFQITALLTTLTATFAYLNHRFLKLPPTVGLMLLSLLFSLLLWSSIAVGVDVVTPARQLMDRIDFDVLFLQGILSLLLFAGALFVKVEELLNVKLSIALFAVAGVLVSAGVIGGGFYLLALLLELPVRLEYALLFGAIMSPTDPVAVLPTLRRLGIPDRLNAWIAGEALFNDGIGIVLFLALRQVADQPPAPGTQRLYRGLRHLVHGGYGRSHSACCTQLVSWTGAACRRCHRRPFQLIKKNQFHIIDLCMGDKKAVKGGSYGNAWHRSFTGKRHQASERDRLPGRETGSLKTRSTHESRESGSRRDPENGRKGIWQHGGRHESIRQGGERRIKL